MACARALGGERGGGGIASLSPIFDSADYSAGLIPRIDMRPPTASVSICGLTAPRIDTRINKVS